MAKVSLERATLATPLRRAVAGLHARIAIAAVVLLAGAIRLDGQGTRASDIGIGIDHLILGVDDLERGMQEFARRTGVMPVKGGVHPGRGTQNALASLGTGQYIEILAPSNESGVQASPMTAFRSLTPVGWALHTSDLARAATLLRDAGVAMSAIVPGARARADGVRLSWQTAAPTDSALQAAPFLITWGAGTPHPSSQSPAGCVLRAVAMREPAPAPLAALLAATGIAVQVTRDAVRSMRVTLSCPKGSVTF